MFLRCVGVAKRRRFTVIAPGRYKPAAYGRRVVGVVPVPASLAALGRPGYGKIGGAARRLPQPVRAEVHDERAAG